MGGEIGAKDEGAMSKIVVRGLKAGHFGSREILWTILIDATNPNPLPDLPAKHEAQLPLGQPSHNILQPAPQLPKHQSLMHVQCNLNALECIKANRVCLPEETQAAMTSSMLCTLMLCKVTR
jgi:hypothetical protein